MTCTAPAECVLATVLRLHDWVLLFPLAFFQNYTTAMNTANQNALHSFVRKYQFICTEILLRFLKDILKVRYPNITKKAKTILHVNDAQVKVLTPILTCNQDLNFTLPSIRQVLYTCNVSEVEIFCVLFHYKSSV